MEGPLKIVGEVTDVTRKKWEGKDGVEREDVTVWLEGLPLRCRDGQTPPGKGMHITTTVSVTWKKTAEGKSYSQMYLAGWGETPR